MLPKLFLTCGGSAANREILIGQSLTFVGAATDGDGDMEEHWMEICNPLGKWNWEGSGPPTTGGWDGAVMGKGVSSKVATFTFSTPGKWQVRTTAVDKANDWQISNDIFVMVKEVVVTPPTPPVPPANPVTAKLGALEITAPLNAQLKLGDKVFYSFSVPGLHTFVVTPPPATPPPLPPTPPASGSAAELSKRLGPTFQELYPSAPDTRVKLPFTPDKQSSDSKTYRANPYNVGEPNGDPTDYWSTSGQVAYVPDNAAVIGIDRVQLFAHYTGVFKTSPIGDWPSGDWRPDPYLKDGRYAKAGQPVATVRNYGMLSNEALAITTGGALIALGTQTSRSSNEYPLPFLQFPATKKLLSIALSTMNEFAFIGLQDSVTGKGQIAVVALEGRHLPFHTWPYLGLANQGVWSDFVLMGYIDLSFSSPDSISAATNGRWEGPSQTDSKVLSQINLEAKSQRDQIYYEGNEPGWMMLVATAGYLIVGSKTDGKAEIWNLEPLMKYVRESWLLSFPVTKDKRAAGVWPLPIGPTTSHRPKLAITLTLARVTAVLAGGSIDRWSQDYHKAHVAQEDGTISIINTSQLMKRWPWEKSGALAVAGKFQIGKNPVQLLPARWGDSAVPLIPINSQPDPKNNYFWAVCRGDRRLELVVTFDGKGQTHRILTDPILKDPVAACVADRANIITVCDFAGKQIVSFRKGSLKGYLGPIYPVGNTATDWVELSGAMPILGHPFSISASNVN